MKTIRRVKVKDLNQDLRTQLVELMVYYKMSYPIGLHKECEIQLDDKSNRIITPDEEYYLDDYTYCYLYMLSNEVIANIYRRLNEENEG